MPFASLRPRNKEAQRCGQRWSITPTRPELSRKAISCSPKSNRRSGAPSRSSSDDIAAGSQYSRISPPITVPEPTRTKSSLSLRFIADFLLFDVIPAEAGIQGRGSRRSPWTPAFAGVTGILRPEREAEPGAGAGRGAIARLVERPFEREMLDRAGDANPVADLRAARIEFFARQPLDRGRVLAAEQVEEAAVERLVDDEMREPARGDDADPRIARIGFDRGADRLAEPIAASRRRLVRRIVGVDADRDDRHDLLHDPLMDKADRVALAFAVGNPVRRGDIELALDQL